MKFEANVLGTMANPVPVPFSFVWKICSQRNAMLAVSPLPRQGGSELVEQQVCAIVHDRNSGRRAAMGARMGFMFAWSYELCTWVLGSAGILRTSSGDACTCKYIQSFMELEYLG